MAVYHDEVEIEDFEYDEELETYFYPCPCGDQFQITKVSHDAIAALDFFNLINTVRLFKKALSWKNW